jgi:hypothetical protein
MTVTVNDPARTRRITYLVLGVAVLLLLGVALVAYSSAKSDAEAEQKAGQFISELNAAGLRAPSQEQVVRVLGDDGGPACADPNSALRKGVLLGQLTNGAAGPGLRPIIADNRVVQGQLIMIKVYCPDELAEFTEFADSLTYADVVKG